MKSNIIGLKLFDGVLQGEYNITAAHCVEMFKVGYRLKESEEHCSKWLSDDDLTKQAYQHLESILGVTL